jgi:hypothetical protein
MTHPKARFEIRTANDGGALVIVKLLPQCEPLPMCECLSISAAKAALEEICGADVLTLVSTDE